MIAFGTNVLDGPSYDPWTSVNLVPSDLRLIRHWLNTTYFKAKNSDENLKTELSSIIGVRMNCIGDEKFDGRPNCEPVLIPGYHYLFEVEAAPISERHRFPIMVRRIPGNVEHWESRNEHGREIPWVNQPATFLHLGCDPSITEYMWKNR
jgi:hypothetical protein